MGGMPLAGSAQVRRGAGEAPRPPGGKNQGRTKMREQEGAKESITRLAEGIDRVVGILGERTVTKQWIRRSVFEKWMEELERKAKKVKAQNATLCWWLRPELRALGSSIRRLKKTGTEKRRRAANERYVERRLQNADADPVLKKLHAAQRKAVVVAEDTQLVLAGAGTGKTQTMAAKVADTKYFYSFCSSGKDALALFHHFLDCYCYSNSHVKQHLSNVIVLHCTV